MQCLKQCIQLTELRLSTAAGYPHFLAQCSTRYSTGHTAVVHVEAKQMQPVGRCGAAYTCTNQNHLQSHASQQQPAEQPYCHHGSSDASKCRWFQLLQSGSTHELLWHCQAAAASHKGLPVASRASIAQLQSSVFLFFQMYSNSRTGNYVDQRAVDKHSSCVEYKTWRT